jgi:hypothetical protein
LLQIVNVTVSNAQAAGNNLQQIAQNALDTAQETAIEFQTSLQATTQNKPAD